MLVLEQVQNSYVEKLVGEEGGGERVEDKGRGGSQELDFSLFIHFPNKT